MSVDDKINEYKKLIEKIDIKAFEDGLECGIVETIAYLAKVYLRFYDLERELDVHNKLDNEEADMCTEIKEHLSDALSYASFTLYCAVQMMKKERLAQKKNDD